MSEGISVAPWSTTAGALGERGQKVLRLIVAGLSSRDIADKDIVSINAVKSQVRSNYGKLGGVLGGCAGGGSRAGLSLIPSCVHGIKSQL